MEIDTSLDLAENPEDNSVGPQGEEDACPVTSPGPCAETPGDHAGASTWRPTMATKQNRSTDILASRRGSEGGFSSNFDGLQKPKKTILKKQPVGSPSARTLANKRYQTLILNFTKKRELAATRKKCAIEEMLKAHPDDNENQIKPTNEELFTKWADAFQLFDAEGEDKLSAAEVGVICRTQGVNPEVISQQTVLEEGRVILNTPAAENDMGLILSNAGTVLDSDKKDSWDMNLRQFLQLAWVLHENTQIDKRRACERRFNLTMSANGQKKPQDHIRDAVMQLYDEAFFTPDDFYRRVNSGSKKEQPKEKEFNTKAAQMSLALQERLHQGKRHATLLTADLQSYVEMATSLTRARYAQMDDLLNQKTVLRAETEVIQKKVQEEEHRLQLLEKKHQDNLVEWQERSEKLLAQKEEHLLLRRRLEIQLRSDRQGAAEFMARTLQKEHQLQELKELLPKCEKLRAELDRLNKENSVIIKLLTDCLTFVEDSLPKGNEVAEKCRQAGMELEMSLRALLNKYHTICVDAGTRVEDVLPYSKVARRPGGYQEVNTGHIPGEIRQVIRPVKKLHLAAKKVVATHALQSILQSVAGSFQMPDVPAHAAEDVLAITEAARPELESATAAVATPNHVPT